MRKLTYYVSVIAREKGQEVILNPANVLGGVK